MINPASLPPWMLPPLPETAASKVPPDGNSSWETSTSRDTAPGNAVPTVPCSAERVQLHQPVLADFGRLRPYQCLPHGAGASDQSRMCGTKSDAGLAVPSFMAQHAALGPPRYPLD